MPSSAHRIERLRARRKARGGFTLIELMVVVAIIAILAAMAMPGIMEASDDRRSFQDANSIAVLLEQARTRAIAHGAAQLVQVTTNGMNAGAVDRGTVLVWEAQSAITIPGQLRTAVSTCKLPGQWTNLQPPNTALANNVTGVLVDGVNLNYAQSIEHTDVFLTPELAVIQGASQAGTPVYLCITPAGQSYVATGSVLPLAGALVSNQVLEVDVRRFEGVNPAGITRRIMMPGSGNARILSQ